MHFNKEGELVNSDGYKVTGFIADESGKITNKQEPIKLGSTTIPAQGTKEVKVNMNIDSRADILEFNLEKPEKTANFTHTMTVYDNIGTARLVTLAYNKVGNNQWKYRALVDGKDAEGGVEGKMYEQASGTLNFNDKGVLQEEISDNNAFNFNKGAAQGQVIAFDFGKALSEGGTGLDASTQYGSDSNINRHTQDGHSAGTLASLSFNDDGVLSAVYDNGVSRDISQMAIAKFENNEGLFKVGKNLYKESKNSGQAAIGKPGESGRGDVLAKSLELSNVDIANEFVGLMTSQRNFQANSRTLTTADQMLQEVLNIKR